MKEPDWDKLRALGREMARLQEERRWTEPEFRRLFHEGKAIAQGYPGALSFLLDHADEDWRARLNQP